MLKAGIKRRRTQRQITDEKAEEAVRQQSIDAKLAQFDQLQEQFKAMKEEAERGKNATIILSDLIENGQAEMDGNGGVRVKPQVIVQDGASQQSQQRNHEGMIEDSNSFQVWNLDIMLSRLLCHIWNLY